MPGFFKYLSLFRASYQQSYPQRLCMRCNKTGAKQMPNLIFIIHRYKDVTKKRKNAEMHLLQFKAQICQAIALFLGKSLGKNA